MNGQKAEWECVGDVIYDKKNNVPKNRIRSITTVTQGEKHINSDSYSIRAPFGVCFLGQVSRNWIIALLQSLLKTRL